MVDDAGGGSEGSFTLDGVWAEFVAWSESFTLPESVARVSWWEPWTWDPWGAAFGDADDGLKAGPGSEEHRTSPSKQHRMSPVRRAAGQKRQHRARSSASCSPAIMGNVANSTINRSRAVEGAHLSQVNESFPTSPSARKSSVRRRSASQRPASTERDEDGYFLEPMALFPVFHSDEHDLAPLSARPLASTRSIVVHSVEFEPSFNPGKRPCIRVELDSDADHSAHDLERCGLQETEWSVEHRFEFPAYSSDDTSSSEEEHASVVTLEIFDGHETEDELASVSIRPGPLTTRECYDVFDNRGEIAGRIKLSMML